MPQNIVLNLVTQSAIAPVDLQGYSVQQLFLTLVEVVDPVLGRALRCDQISDFYRLSALQVKAELYEYASYSYAQGLSSSATPSFSASSFSVGSDSTLQYNHTQGLPSQTQCWLRISFLDDELFDHIAFLWRQLKGDLFQLGSGSVSLCNVTTDVPTNMGMIAWANCCSYQHLYEQASRYEREIQLQFVTPTALKSKRRKVRDGQDEDAYTPLPTAEAVFQPLRKCWNRYSKLAFTPHLTRHIIPIDFNLKTQSVQYIQRHSIQTFTGCIGTIRFQIERQSDPLTVKQINAIANFAQYCNIGQGARFGMGMVKRLSNPVTLLDQPVNLEQSIKLN